MHAPPSKRRVERRRSVDCGVDVTAAVQPPPPAEASDIGRNQVLDAARAGLRSVSNTASESVARALQLLTEQKDGSGPERKEAEAQIRSALECILPSAMAIAAELWDAASSNTRNQLKAQQVFYEMKLETARTAAKVEMDNQQAQLEKGYHRKLEQAGNDDGSLRTHRTDV